MKNNKNNWLPKWLGLKYAILYSKFKGKKFGFEQAKKELNLNDQVALKVMSELGKHGFLLTGGGNYRYTLVDFESICSGMWADFELKNLDIDEKLKEIHKKYKKSYLIAESYAAFLYNEYQVPIRHKVEVFARDYGFWKNISGTEPIPTLTKKSFKEKIILRGIFVSRPEKVVIECLEKATVSSTLDAICVLVSEKAKTYLNWQNLKKSAIEKNVINELGALLEILEKEIEHTYNKKLISKKYLDELFTHIKLKGRNKIFPIDTFSKEIYYKDIAKKWRINLYSPRNIFENAVNDVAPFGLGIA